MTGRQRQIADSMDMHKKKLSNSVNISTVCFPRFKIVKVS